MSATTAGELESGILAALEAHDVHTAVEILEVLGTVDLQRAIAMHERLTEAVTVARWLNGEIK